MDENQRANPYAAPAELQIVEPVKKESWYRRQDYFLRSAICWASVCLLSAAPSFFLGFASIAQYQIPAMLLGIASFVGIYVGIDCATKDWSIRSAGTAISTTMRITYIIRVVMSLLFPVAIWADMIAGVLAINSYLSIVGHSRLNSETAQFVDVYIVTMIQGTYLNIILALISLPILGIVSLVKGVKQQ